MCPSLLLDKQEKKKKGGLQKAKEASPAGLEPAAFGYRHA